MADGTAHSAPIAARLRSALGLGRSLALYYGNPLRARGLVRFYRGLIAPGDLVFDVGAHVGSRARALRAAGARVVALEPQEPFATFLRRTLPHDIVLVTAAAGPTESVAEMAVSRRHPTVSSLSTGFTQQAAGLEGFGHVAWDARQVVQVTTLDALIAAHGVPAFVKIDVEGFELDVLLGLSVPVRLVSVEYLPGMADRTRAVLDRLAQIGRYRFNAVTGERGAFLWNDWRDGQQVGDWLAGLPPGSQSGDLYARLDDGGGR
jgi:FkbM family methyltransferase